MICKFCVYVSATCAKLAMQSHLYKMHEQPFHAILLLANIKIIAWNSLAVSKSGIPIQYAYYD